MGQSQGQKEKVARHHDILAWSTEESESLALASKKKRKWAFHLLSSGVNGKGGLKDYVRVSQQGRETPVPSCFTPCQAPKRIRNLWQKMMLLSNMLSPFGMSCGFAHLNKKVRNVYMLR